MPSIVSSAVRIYVDGMMVASGTIAGALWQTTTTYFTIGQRNGAGGGFEQLWTGRLSNPYH